MIAVDANVLLRLFVDDNAEQHRKAKAFFAARSLDDPAYVDLLVLAEFIWLLDRRYGYPIEQIVASTRFLLGTADIAVEHPDLVGNVLDSASPRVGIVDRLIAAKALNAGASHTVTFDRSAAREIVGMELLK
jgi:predicted nucleic-acid-binding protein